MSRGDAQPARALAKPAFSDPQASALVESVFGLKVSQIRPLPSYDDQNFHVRVAGAEGGPGGPCEYVLKISNAEASRTPELLQVQTHALLFLRAAGLPTASVCRSKGGGLTSLVSADGGSRVTSYVVRLLTYLPGIPVAEVPVGPLLLYEIGRLAANLDETLEKFHHPKLSCLHRENFIWNLRNVPLLEKHVDILGQGQNRELVVRVIQLFKDEVLTKLKHFRECLNHGDLNDHNILVESSKSACGDAAYQVSGILDFDDMSYGYYVFEAAITIMYMMIESKSPMHVGGHVLAGFESVIPLTPVERGALFLLVCSRFCQSLVMAAYSCQLHPENEEYLMITAKTGWKHLQQLFDLGQRAVEEIWFETARSYTSGLSM
ncbi:hydroxylysine kinase isoform X1 [Canis lupus familiaris]|uniref:Hydroxylysine kinase n=5 Tax=Canis lupus familiaris TaxID=9615 RepID=A0A8P0NR40_CANLF|nr:hydroxylysine kinase isoform X1 [Canis lupus familiaris]XP_038541390.1 hydroxylysine kinase isoform X1 [Canis lupus familiaris]XP_038541391.1 hydroxylysine kinase isoform X1 [Canis lupus familiaris]XP_532363.2 hydroxylysine kinase isoform X1 [Canis lupus familiaris]|eukprot:XP_005628188.1 hydroxylysine kinase isoform X1 [Canis lupus familiaris]